MTYEGLDEKGNPQIKKVPLEKCLEREGYADLDSLNSQGFPTKKSPVQTYEPGKSVYFTSPVNGLAVRFISCPDDAYLGCGRDPLLSDSALGVFTCAEGVAKNSK